MKVGIERDAGRVWFRMGFMSGRAVSEGLSEKVTFKLSSER